MVRFLVDPVPSGIIIQIVMETRPVLKIVDLMICRLTVNMTEMPPRYDVQVYSLYVCMFSDFEMTSITAIYAR
jgi:hypothetical protein